MKLAALLSFFSLALTACSGCSRPSSSSRSPGFSPPATVATTGSSSGAAPTTASGCAVFPPDNPWNRDISREPVDPNSDGYMAAMNAGRRKLHPDFGSNPAFGIPFLYVPGTQPRVPVTFEYADESDPGPYPIPLNAPIEGGPGASGDRHILAVDRDACVLYELYAAAPIVGGFKAGSGAKFDLRSNALRPDGFTSADAAGLPIFPGLARRDEIMSGEIRHALRFTVAATQAAFVHPATHRASNKKDPNLPPMGLRVRLKASFDLSRVTGASKIILTALKRYGMFVADNGADWFISGATDPGWNDDDLAQIKAVPASAFEVVKAGPLITK